MGKREASAAGSALAAEGWRGRSRAERRERMRLLRRSAPPRPIRWERYPIRTRGDRPVLRPACQICGGVIGQGEHYRCRGIRGRAHERCVEGRR